MQGVSSSVAVPSVLDRVGLQHPLSSPRRDGERPTRARSRSPHEALRQSAHALVTCRRSASRGTSISCELCEADEEVRSERTHPGHANLVSGSAREERSVHLGLGDGLLVLFAAHRGSLGEDERVRGGRELSSVRWSSCRALSINLSLALLARCSEQCMLTRILLPFPS